MNPKKNLSLRNGNPQVPPCRQRLVEHDTDEPLDEDAPLLPTFDGTRRGFSTAGGGNLGWFHDGLPSGKRLHNYGKSPFIVEIAHENYFTSCDPHHDIYTFSYWQILRHSI